MILSIKYDTDSFIFDEVLVTTEKISLPSSPVFRSKNSGTTSISFLTYWMLFSPVQLWKKRWNFKTTVLETTLWVFTSVFYVLNTLPVLTENSGHLGFLPPVLLPALQSPVLQSEFPIHTSFAIVVWLPCPFLLLQAMTNFAMSF